MLSISQARTAGGATSYYLHMEKDSMGQIGEYYAKEGEAGYWIGNGANRLGLEGAVDGATFKGLAEGFDRDGNPLMRNAGDPNRRAGWDLTFSAPKSVSVAWSVADGPTRQAIERAHAEAVRQGFNVMQEHAAFGRTGAQGRNLQRAELVGAAFQHGTSRELDAQLHTHVFVMNLALMEGRPAASIESVLLFDYKMAAGAAYQCALAHELDKLGYQLERDGMESFRIASVPRALEEAQSTRRSQIEAEVAKTGQTGAKAAARATLATRKAKAEPSLAELRQAWATKAQEHGYTAAQARPATYPSPIHQNLKENHYERADHHPRARTGELPKPDAHRAARLGRVETLGRTQSANLLRTLQDRRLDPQQGRPAVLLQGDARHRVEQVRNEQLGQLRRTAAVEQGATRDLQERAMPTARDVLRQATERDAIITKVDMLRDAYRLSIGQGSTLQAEAVAGRAMRQAVAVERIDGERHPREDRLGKFTTRDLMRAERDVLRIATERRGEMRHVVGREAIEAALARTAEDKGYQLNAEQRAAVEKLAGTPGGVQVMVGDAGTGKSSTLHAVREAHEAAGLRVIGTSSGGKASAELMASSGIDSRSIAKLQSDLELGREQLNARTVLVIDEAGMTSSRDMAALMRAADEAGAKVILVGDWKQLQPVGAGETFRAVDQALGSARLEQINRQSQEWERGTVKELSRGEAAQALKTYAEQGRIHIDATYQKAIKDVATRHVENMREVGQDKAVALAGTRQAVDHINEAVRAELKREGQLGEGEKFTTKDEQRNIGTREIELAKGDRVMIATTDTEKGYTNGDAGRVVGMDAKAGTIEVKLDRTGETVKVNTQEAEVRHGYAMTTHKSQGSTYDRATVYLDSNTSREMAYVQASRAKEETHFVTTRHSVAEMRRDTPAPEALQNAVDQVAAAREAVGKDAGLEPDTKASMQNAIDYIQANKDHAPKEAIREAKNAATMEALASAMSRSRPKETTLDYQVKPGQEGGRRVLAEQHEAGRSWKESLSRVELAVAARDQADAAQQAKGYERDR